VKKKLIPTTKSFKRNDCIQTPIETAKLLVSHFNPEGRILEPCCGNGAFLKVLPKETLWCEVDKGRDFFEFIEKVDWIITNPPFSKIRKFTNHAMDLSENIVFLTTINHLWLKARIRDIEKKGFGIKEIVIIETPRTFPASGFQVGAYHLMKGYRGDIKFERLIDKSQCALPQHDVKTMGDETNG